MKNIILISFLVAVFTVQLSAQATDNQPIKRDSTPSVSASKTLGNDSFPVPKKALLWAIVPGGGQVYNRKQAWWKAPVVWGAFGASGYFIVLNTQKYQQFKTAYSRKVNQLPINDPQISENAAAEKLKQARDGYFKRVQQSYIAVGVTYLVSGVWAFADAHLAHFDVNDDLSMRIKPAFEPMPVGNALGIGLNVKF
jgi:Family of unknown function (DUF5683)